ncbi:MAG: lipolytic protein family [Bacteroidetes bacterium]|nr:lipolytic protein family [Bacteroidota bacterium]
MKKPIRYLFLTAIIIFMQSNQPQTLNELKYLPLGDSYTICTGATEKESWPVILTAHLNKENIKILLVDNPARNGYSTQDLIDNELPLVKKLKPDFITLLIGVNDWVRNVPSSTFKKNLIFILDEVEQQLQEKKNIVLITIPDFGVTPSGKHYGGGRNISEGISEFNEIIKEESKKRQLKLVDIYSVSKNMKDDVTLVAKDGLHPSVKEYAIWETLIFKEVKKVLDRKKGG